MADSLADRDRGSRGDRVYYHTFGCKANQYDTEMMRQVVEGLGRQTTRDRSDADVFVVNTCTVTNQADAQARRFVGRIKRENPEARIVVAGCSAALRPESYRVMPGVVGVVPGPDPVAVSEAVAAVAPAGLVRLGLRSDLARIDSEPVGAELLRERQGATRGWLKIQEGCDRHCSFCATRLARGPSRSRAPDVVLAEAAMLARHHPELVLTGIHIGHYGKDLDRSDGRPVSLGELLAELLEHVPDVRFRLGSVEATEVDDRLLEVLTTSGGRVAPHLHMPLQSGADPVLRRMRRWHTRDMYRERTLEIASRLETLGLGADVITGFPGETEEDHAQTRALIEQLPFTYLHVFPFSPREGTVAAELAAEMPVPQRIAGERSRDLRELATQKGLAYRRRRAGQLATVTLEGDGTQALTGDYLRIAVTGAGGRSVGRLHRGRLSAHGADLRIDLTPPSSPF